MLFSTKQSKVFWAPGLLETEGERVRGRKEGARWAEGAGVEQGRRHCGRRREKKRRKGQRGGKVGRAKGGKRELQMWVHNVTLGSCCGAGDLGIAERPIQGGDLSDFNQV